ncbi:MAG: hypothetical protein R3E10_09945 [Gemmatimonadota bacterium]
MKRFVCVALSGALVACASVPTSHVWRPAAELGPEQGVRAPMGAHEWRFAYENEGSAGRAFLELWSTPHDPDLPDRVLARQAVAGLSFDAVRGEVVWTSGAAPVVCARVSSDLWSGYRPELRATGDCRLRCEHETVQLDSGTRIARSTAETVRVEVRAVDGMRTDER